MAHFQCVLDPFLSNGLRRGAKTAHSYIRAPVAWSSDPTTLGDEGEGWTAHITERLGREREMWKGCWDATESLEPQFLPPFPSCPLEPRLDPRIAQKTASSFKLATCTPDGVHPRHFGFLSPRGLEALTWILWTIDVTGQCPEQIQDVQVQLYPKPEKGVRPIGFFRALFRLWGKTKKPLVKAWEHSRGQHASFSMSPGVSAIDPVWRQSIRSEHHTGSGNAFALFLWDILKCYEHVRHRLLRDEAVQLAFPIVVIRCSLAAYAWPRVLQLECAAAAPLFPRRGIIAGAFAATSELKCYMFRAVSEYVTLFPPPAQYLNIHVDDSGLDITRPSEEECFCDAVAAAEPLIRVF